MLKSRVITAIVLLLLLLSALFLLPAMAWAVLAIVMVMQGVTEWSKLAKLESTAGKVYWGLTLVIMVAIQFFAPQAQGAQLAMHLWIYAVSAVLWLFIVPTWMIASWKVENPIVMALVGWALLIPTGLAMMDLRAISPWLLLFVMGLVWVADSAAYFAGRKFGKRKLAPSISPGKTWEGVAGAMLGVTIYVVAVWNYMGGSMGGHAVLPVLLLAAWWWVGLAIIGDLFESAIKRQAGVKDSGALLPGHGGLLDRIDALTSTLPLAALVVLLQVLR